MRVSDLAHQDQNIHKSSLFKFWSSTQDKREYILRNLDQCKLQHVLRTKSKSMALELGVDKIRNTVHSLTSRDTRGH